ncbi:MAG TPA: alpha/beta fold hydrolase [Kofleriaceae bacterium]|nr:alpha/beta fold hydrolase [Kofleriaceae bacterium]
MTSPLPRRAYLAIELGPDEHAFTPNGAVVDGVLPGGMAELAGVRAGDIVASLGGASLRSLDELGVALRLVARRSTVALSYTRDGASILRDVSVISVPNEPGFAYDHVTLDDARLRVITSSVATPRALILAIQGIACDTIESGPIAELARAWTAAGFDTLRIDKPGVGDSEGASCHAIDFDAELACFVEAAERALALAEARSIPLVLFGHSVGSIVAAALAPHVSPAAIVTYGAPFTRWLACLVETTRRQLALRGVDADAIERAARHVHERAFVDGYNTRSAAYHRQLDQLDPAALWSRVTAPTLVLRGEHDWVVRADDQAALAAATGGTLVDLPGLDHVMGSHPDVATSQTAYGAGPFDPAIASASIRWLEKTLIPSAR